MKQSLIRCKFANNNVDRKIFINKTKLVESGIILIPLTTDYSKDRNEHEHHKTRIVDTYVQLCFIHTYYQCFETKNETIINTSYITYLKTMECKHRY